MHQTEINRCRSLFSFSRHLLICMLIALCITKYKNQNNRERDEEEKRFNIWIGDVSLIEIQKISILDLV